jgi:hypothetical protein
MYKTLCVAVLLLPTFALAQARNVAVTSISPPIVAKGKLINQSAVIPTTTIFTPTQTGLYRLSVYGTITTITTGIASSWIYNFYWNDDSGQQSAEQLLLAYGDQYGQFSQLTSVGAPMPLGGPTLVFEAKAGTPVNYSVTGGNDGSAFSLYYTLERLE